MSYNSNIEAIATILLKVRLVRENTVTSQSTTQAADFVCSTLRTDVRLPRLRQPCVLLPRLSCDLGSDHGCSSNLGFLLRLALRLFFDRLALRLFFDRLAPPVLSLSYLKEILSHPASCFRSAGHT